MTNPHQKIFRLDDLAAKIETLRETGISVALSHGVYDVLHPGHYRHLRAARELADVLVVTVTADNYVGKGPGRPVFNENLRMESLASLESVDFVACVHSRVAVPAIEMLRPDVYVKGQEYADEDADVTGNIRNERTLVEKSGGRIEYTNDVVFSSSELINRLMPTHSEAVREWLTAFRAHHSLDEVLEWIDRISDLRVTVIGETILDDYTYCETLGKASKEPVLCLNRGETTRHAGGILAVAGHCAGLGASTSVITGWNSLDTGEPWNSGLAERGITVRHVETDPRPTIRKERLIDRSTESRVVEVYTMDDDPLSGFAEEYLISLISDAHSMSDVVVVADYGHGLISSDAAAALSNGSSFTAINVQTNAGNHGFNSLSKYPRADLATMNGHEARLEARHRHTDLDSFVPKLVEQLNAGGILVTQGGDGLDHYLNDGTVVRSMALAPYIKDRVGAGDAVLATTSLLASLGAPAPIIGFVGNVVGAWAVSFIGNEQVIEAGQLKRQVKALLK